MFDSLYNISISFSLRLSVIKINLKNIIIVPLVHLFKSLVCMQHWEIRYTCSHKYEYYKNIYKNTCNNWRNTIKYLGIKL